MKRLALAVIGCAIGACCKGESAPSSPVEAVPSASPSAPTIVPKADVHCAKAGTFPVGRYGHTVTKLADGRVLVAGGKLHDGADFVADVDLWNPTDRAFSRGEKLTHARADHAAVRLKNGDVLLFGGQTEARGGAGLEVFDAKTGRVQAGPKLGDETTLVSPFLAAMSDGRAFVAGGDLMRKGAMSDQAFFFDPETAKATKTTPLPRPGAGEARGRPDGKLLLLFADPTADHDEAWLFDTARAKYAKAHPEDVPKVPPRGDSFLDAEVLEGGDEGATLARSEDALYRWDPQNAQWIKTATLIAQRTAAVSARLSPTEILVVGGFGPGPTYARYGDAEICPY